MNHSYSFEVTRFSLTHTAYPELFAIVGATVPDLRERTTWGGEPGQYREAGLPNIAGNFETWGEDGMNEITGPFERIAAVWSTKMTHNEGSPTGWQVINMDASRVSSIYGRSTTVQPAAYTVRYLIRAL